MLEVLGADSIDELFETIPEKTRLGVDLSIPRGISELELLENGEAPPMAPIAAEPEICAVSSEPEFDELDLGEDLDEIDLDTTDVDLLDLEPPAALGQGPGGGPGEVELELLEPIDAADPIEITAQSDQDTVPDLGSESDDGDGGGGDLFDRNNQNLSAGLEDD